MTNEQAITFCPHGGTNLKEFQERKLRGLNQ